jgi:hypothetical protein
VRAAKAMVLAMRVAGNKEGNSNSKEGNGNKGGGQAVATRMMETATATATTRAMAMGIRLAGNKESKSEGGKDNGNGNMIVVAKEEGKGSNKVMVTMVIRMAGEWTATATKRAMAMRVAGKRQQQ